MAASRSFVVVTCCRCSGGGRVAGDDAFRACPVCRGTGELRQVVKDGAGGRLKSYRRPRPKANPHTEIDEHGRAVARRVKD
jgi:hypothetical protein